MADPEYYISNAMRGKKPTGWPFDKDSESGAILPIASPPPPTHGIAPSTKERC